jgi:hypothetical protein
MTVQKLYSRTNPVQPPENPNGKTVAQVDGALRDFVLQDTAHLRRIVDLRQLRDFLHSEGERIQREISGYLQLNHVAMGSTKSIVDSIGQWKTAAVRLGKGRAQTERSDTASPSPATPS